MRIVNEDLSPTTAPLVTPSTTGYLLLAVEVDRRPMVLPDSRVKALLIRESKSVAAELERLPEVVRATVFRGFTHLVLGENRRLLRNAVAADRLWPARYDLVILIEVTHPATIDTVRSNRHYGRLSELMAATARRTFEVAADNPRSMGDVDASRQGVFLFNFFYGRDETQLMPVWEYTAGWWAVNTALDNSRVMQPLDGERHDYGIINHCRWDRLRDVAPQMIVRPSFRRFVLANFAANDISAQPTLYRLA
ncbi:hypothetical protein [Nocardia sp. CNY236]|uniref:hypothetical protein n=1 Tax=Nocardia sp. CNY236 TaxID=1169152 RepID=UPI000428A603|nr:hypothetical protein [Nocardia sp. CNY236]